MKNFIESLSIVTGEIMNQLINKDIKKENTSLKNQLKITDTISVITSIKSRKNSFQIIVSFSEELAKKISSLVGGGVPIVIIDSQCKEIIMEISKLIISNSIIYLEDYDETCSPSPPCLIQASNISYSASRPITILEFKLIEEIFSIAIITSE